MTKITYEEWTKENPIDFDNYDDDEEDGMINEMHYQCKFDCLIPGTNSYNDNILGKFFTRDLA